VCTCGGRAQRQGQGSFRPLQIHDELVFEVREDVLLHAARVVKHVMEVRRHPAVQSSQGALLDRTMLCRLSMHALCVSCPTAFVRYS
jgi:hypothetical protein